MLSFLVTCYLFLGGAGAGACFVAVTLGLLSPRELVEGRDAPLYGRLLVPSFLAAALLMLVGVICLAADLGRADRVMLLLQSPALTHIAVGAYALAASLILAVLLAFMWKDAANRGPATRRILGLCGGHTHGMRMVLEIAALVTALVTMAYTGLLLHDASAVPLWTTPWLPVLFVLSSLSCGLAVVLGVSQLTGSARVFGSAFGRLAGVDVAAIALEAISAGCVIFSARSGAGFGGQTALAAQDSVARLLSGDLAELFWVGFVVVGLVAPAAVETLLVFRRRVRQLERGRHFSRLMSPLPSASSTLFAAACVLVGGFALRACVVDAGMHPILSTMGVM